MKTKSVLIRALALGAVAVSLSSVDAGQWRWAIKTGPGGLTAAATNRPRKPVPPVQPAPQPPAYLPPSPTLPPSPVIPQEPAAGSIFIWSSSIGWGFWTGLGWGW